MATDDARDARLEELSRRLATLEDKELIRDVLYRNSRGMDRGDAPLLKETYHPDSYEVHWETFTGNGHEFSEYITSELSTIRSVQHALSNPLIEIDGDRALVETAYTARTLVDRLPELGGSVETVVWGRYVDVFEKRDGSWRIAYRQLARDGARQTIIDNPIVPREETRGWPGPKDPTYLGFGIAELRPVKQGGTPGKFAEQRTIQ